MANEDTTEGLVLALDGQFDFSQRDRLKDAFDAAIGARTVVLDISRTAFIDSTVLGAFLRLRAQIVEGGGSLVIAGPSVMVKRLFEITDLTQIFDIRDSLGDVDGAAAFRRIELVSDET